jgi:uncharacterized membrane protein
LWWPAFAAGGAVLAGLAILKHWLLQSTAADLGIFVQYCWLIAHSYPATSTLSGTSAFADHKAYVLYPLAFLCGPVGGPAILLVVQAAALAAAGAVIQRLSIQIGHDSAVQRVAVTVWFLYPTTLLLALSNFHLDVLAIPALLAMMLYARARAWLPYCACTFFALGCKDTLAFTVMGVGVWVFLAEQRVAGLLTVVAAVGWFTTTLWLEHGSPAHTGFVARYAYLGDTPLHIVLHVLREPTCLFHRASVDGWLLYPAALLLPVTPWLRRRSWLAMLPALPHFILNILSSAPQQQDISYQYTAGIAPFVVLGALDGVPKSIAEIRHFALRFAVTLGTFLWLSRIDLFFGRYLGRLPLRMPATEAFHQIAPDDRVLAASYLTTHLAERRVIEVPMTFVEGHLENMDVLLVSETDPGDDVQRGVVVQYVEEARRLHWSCREFGEGQLVSCRSPTR